jgi:arsenite transporter
MTGLLRFAGKNGAWVAITGVVLGLCFPVVSELTRPYLAVPIFLFTFGSFLKIDAPSIREQMHRANVAALMVLWANAGVPLAVSAIIRLTHPEPALAQGLLFWALVPTSPACVAFAAILGLRTPLALLATVLATTASPFYLPVLAAALGGYQLTVDPVAMSAQLLLIVGGAGLSAWLVKRFAADFVRNNPDAITGIAVLALILAGMGSMRGMGAYFLSQPVVALQLLAFSYGLNLGFQLCGTLIFWRCDRSSALTAGLISGTRTITLAWVVLGASILPLADVFFATGMVAKYTCPALTKWLVARLNQRLPNVLATGA